MALDFSITYDNIQATSLAHYASREMIRAGSITVELSTPVTLVIYDCLYCPELLAVLTSEL